MCNLFKIIIIIFHFNEKNKSRKELPCFILKRNIFSLWNMLEIRNFINRMHVILQSTN